MLSSKPALRFTLFAALAVFTTTLGACTLTPVYSGRMAEHPSLDLAFAKPTSRIEQIINQDLALRLGVSELETAPLAKVTASAAVTGMALTQTANPNKPNEVTVTATLTITQRDASSTPAVTLTRIATANFTTSGQISADQAAQTEATERAAHAVAESLRLAVLAALMR